MSKEKPVIRKLLVYIKDNIPMKEREEFAVRIGTTYKHLQQIAYGNRPCNPVYAVNIDRETGGQVPMQEMCPEIDWDHVFSAMQNGDVSVDWEQVKARVHSAVDSIEFGDYVPLSRGQRNDTVSAG